MVKVRPPIKAKRLPRHHVVVPKRAREEAKRRAESKSQAKVGRVVKRGDCEAGFSRPVGWEGMGKREELWWIAPIQLKIPLNYNIHCKFVFQMLKTIIKSFGSSVHLSPNNWCISKTFDVQNNMVRIYLMTTVKKLVQKVDSLGSYMSVKGATFDGMLVSDIIQVQ